MNPFLRELLGIIAIFGIWLFGEDLLERLFHIVDEIPTPTHFILRRVQYFNHKEK